MGTFLAQLGMMAAGKLLDGMLRPKTPPSGVGAQGLMGPSAPGIGQFMPRSGIPSMQLDSPMAPQVESNDNTPPPFQGDKFPQVQPGFGMDPSTGKSWYASPMDTGQGFDQYIPPPQFNLYNGGYGGY